jgi:hypothetical protein
MLGLVPPLVWSGNLVSVPDHDRWVSLAVLALAAGATVVAHEVDRRTRVRPAIALAERDRLGRQEPIPQVPVAVGR